MPKYTNIKFLSMINYRAPRTFCLCWARLDKEAEALRKRNLCTRGKAKNSWKWVRRMY